MKIKILFFVLALFLYGIWLIGLGFLFNYVWGVDLSDFEGNKILAHMVIGGMGIGILYAVYSAFDFATYMAKNADKITSDNAR